MRLGGEEEEQAYGQESGPDELESYLRHRRTEAECKRVPPSDPDGNQNGDRDRKDCDRDKVR
jgi:hypothetical protein